MINEEILMLFMFLEVDDHEPNEYFYTRTWQKNITNMNTMQFNETFRMSIEIFSKFFEFVKLEYPTIKNLKIKLLVYIFYIGHVSPFRKLRELFGIPKSSIWLLIEEMHKILYKLAEKNIMLPTPGEYEDLKRGFFQKGNVQNTIMAIDGTHLEIRAPKKNPGLYFNRKHYYSINYLCAVDYNYRFIFVTFGFGSAHDNRIFRNSVILDYCAELENYNVHVVADKAFSGLAGIMIPNFEDENNIEFEKQRVVIENAFGLLKNKFKKFSSMIINGEDKRYIKHFINACFLHNLIIDLK